MRGKTQAAFRRHRRRLARLLPRADIQHIGGTAIPGAITKGDLDILVCVSRADFARADKLLATGYARNAAAHRSRSFSSFKDDEADPPLGIQLATHGSALYQFTVFRDALVADTALVKRIHRESPCLPCTLTARWVESDFAKRAVSVSYAT